MSNIIKRDFHGIQIAFEGKEQVSLTDLWRAAGSERTNAPNFWTEQEQSARFIETIAKNLNATKDCIINR